MKKDLKKTRRGGFYWKKDTPYLSVTTILKTAIDKPALRWWFGQQVYLAMVEDPTLSQQAALAAPYKKSKKAAQRGTDVHELVEVYKKDPDFQPQEHEGYWKALQNAMQSIDLKIIGQEKTVFNEEHRYAGTLDMLATLNGKLTILDIKTGKNIYPEAFIQTSAYAKCKINGHKPEQLAVLLLQEDGAYKLEVREDIDRQFKTFLACKYIHETVCEEDLIKVGYLISN